MNVMDGMDGLDDLCMPECHDGVRFWCA